MLTAKENGNRSSYPGLEPGLYLAVCYSVVDIGEHENRMYNNTSRQVVLTWELPNEMIEVEERRLPRAVSKFFTLSLNEKAKLRGFLENWRGRAFSAEELAGFDLKNLLGVPCMLNMVEVKRQDSAKQTVVGSVSRVPKGMAVPPLSNLKVAFDLDAPGAVEQMAALPEWLQNKIRESITYQNMMRPQNAGAQGAVTQVDALEDEPQDLPF